MKANFNQFCPLSINEANEICNMFREYDQDIGQLKNALLRPHMLPKFLAVICVLKAIMIIEFGRIKSK